jgi:tRNA A-37 threonylcarbamoyl transferase component Bud32
MANSLSSTGTDIGEVLGGCILVHLIGKGAMGAVYEARQVSLERRVAVKVHRLSKSADQELTGNLFVKEARLVARLNHPNIVQIFDVGRQGDLLYMIMEYVEGVTLKDLMAGQGPFPIERLFRIARKVARGLAAAHRENIVHRDIKPENVLLTSSGEVKIADFGAASFLLGDDDAARSCLIGTPLYMAPEVISRQPSDGRADVYALGLILYTAAAGAHPFRDPDMKAILRSQVHEPLPPLEEARPELHPDFARLIEKLCAKKPHSRHSSEELLEILEAHPEWERPQRGRLGGAAAAPAGASGPAEDGTERIASTPPIGRSFRGARPAVPSAGDGPADGPSERAGGAVRGAGAPADGLEDHRPAGNPSEVRGSLLSILGASLRSERRESPEEAEAAAVSPPVEAPAPPAASAAPEPPPAGPARFESKAVQELCIQARFHLMKKQLDKAEALFRKALDVDPRSEEALLGLARLLTAERRSDEAVAVLRRAMSAGNVGARRILDAPHFDELRSSKAFRRLMAEHSL